MRVDLEVLGRNRRYVWFRLPQHVIEKQVILTMPRRTLPRGMASVTLVSAEVDPDSVFHDGHGWVADMKVLNDESSDASSSGA